MGELEVSENDISVKLLLLYLYFEENTLLNYTINGIHTQFKQLIRNRINAVILILASVIWSYYIIYMMQKTQNTALIEGLLLKNASPLEKYIASVDLYK